MSIDDSIPGSKAAWAILVLNATLFLVWPIPHTIVLRKFLLVMTALAGIILLLKSDDRQRILKSSWIIFLGMLFVWVIFHAGIISENGIEAWKEFSRQWLQAGLAVFSGAGLALASRGIKPRNFKIALIVILSVLPVVFLLASLYKSVQQENWTLGYYVIGGTDNKISLTYYSNLLAALFCAKFLYEFKCSAGNYMSYYWLIPLPLTMAVSIFATSLNSIILVSASIFIMLLILLFKVNALRVYAISIILISVILGFALYKKSEIEHQINLICSNIRTSVDIDNNQNWINFRKHGLPNSDLGEQVSESLYLRAAYAMAGVQAVISHPFGYGISVHAFERLVQRDYSDVEISHAHNGFINLAASVGIPALVLLILMVVSVYRQLNQSRSEWSGIAVWVIGIYTAHWALDAMERDHFFESYLFVIALLMVLVVIDKAGHE